MISRRNFLAGLLATTAAVPLAKAVPFTGSMDSAGVVLSPDMADAMVLTFYDPSKTVRPPTVVVDVVRGESIYRTHYLPLNAMLPKGDWRHYARIEPHLGMVYYDEACDISPETFATARRLLDSAPVPGDGDRYVMTEHGWKQGVGFYTKRQGEAMVPLATEAPQHDATDGDPRPELPRNPRPDRDL